MDIRFVSTLTPDDEERVASALLAALAALLDELPITYALRIETTSNKVLHRTNMPSSEQHHDILPEAPAEPQPATDQVQ